MISLRPVRPHLLHSASELVRVVIFCSCFTLLAVTLTLSFVAVALGREASLVTLVCLHSQKSPARPSGWHTLSCFPQPAELIGADPGRV